MTKYRILFVDHTPFIGGGQLALGRHLRHLDRSCFTPLVFCSPSVPDLLEKFRQTGAQVSAFPFGQLKVFSPVAAGRLLATAWRLGKVICREKADLVVANSERAFYPALLVSFFARKKLVLWVRDFEYPRFLLSFFSRLVAKFVFVSRVVRDYYGFTSSPKARVIYVGTDMRIRRPEGSVADPSGLRASWGLGENDIAIGFAGRLVSWKGASTLLAAVSLLKKAEPSERPAFKIIIAGEGRGQEGGNTEELKACVHQHYLESAVDFVGFLPNMALFYRSLDIFVHPPLKPEPFATVVVEAMAVGLPVVASSVGGTLEIISGGENGLLFSPGDACALADCLRKLLSDASLRQRLGKAASLTVADNFTEEKVTREMEAVYREVLGE